MDSGPSPQPQPEQDHGSDPAYQPTISGSMPPGGYPPATPPDGYPPATPPDGFIPAQPYPSYPYTGDQPPWPVAPQAAPPRERPRRRRGKVIGITAAILVVVVAAAAAAVVLLLKKAETPTMMALESGRALAPAAGLDLTGTMDGKPANVTVTSAGTVSASYTQGLSQVSRITLGGVTYLKAPSAYWNLEFGPTTGGQVGSHWAKVSQDQVFMSFDSFTPSQIAHVLEHVGEHPRATQIMFGGHKAIRLTAGQTVYYITADTPNRLLHMDGTSGGVRYSFDLTPLTATTIAPVFTILHGDVQAMQGTPEPEALVDPQQKIQFHQNCNGNSSCTVSIKAKVTDSVSPQVLLTLTVSFSGTKNGHPFATCTDAVTVNTSGTTATVSPSCGLAHPAWSKWVNSHSSDFNTWADPQFKVTINSGSDIAAMQKELNTEQGT